MRLHAADPVQYFDGRVFNRDFRTAAAGEPGAVRRQLGQSILTGRLTALRSPFTPAGDQA